MAIPHGSMPGAPYPVTESVLNYSPQPDGSAVEMDLWIEFTSFPVVKAILTQEGSANFGKSLGARFIIDAAVAPELVEFLGKWLTAAQKAATGMPDSTMVNDTSACRKEGVFVIRHIDGDDVITDSRAVHGMWVSALDASPSTPLPAHYMGVPSVYVEIIADQVEPLHEPVIVGAQAVHDEKLMGFKAHELQWPGPKGDPAGKPFAGVDLAKFIADHVGYLPVYTTPPIIAVSTKKNKKTLTEKGKATLARFGAVEK